MLDKLPVLIHLYLTTNCIMWSSPDCLQRRTLNVIIVWVKINGLLANKSLHLSTAFKVDNANAGGWRSKKFRFMVVLHIQKYCKSQWRIFKVDRKKKFFFLTSNFLWQGTHHEVSWGLLTFCMKSQKLAPWKIHLVDMFYEIYLVHTNGVRDYYSCSTVSLIIDKTMS